MNGHIKTQVLIPRERVSEFYDFYASWLRNEQLVPAELPDADGADLEHWTGGEVEGEDPMDERLAAEAIWIRLSPRAQALFRLLAQEPGRRYTAQELAQLLDIPNGMYGVAGVLAWPARHAQAAGYRLPIYFEPGEAGEGASYWMAPEVAESFVPVMKG